MEDTVMGTLMKTNSRMMPELPSLFDDFFTRDLFKGWLDNDRETLPAVNIRETDDSFELEVAAPGMNKKDFKVELDNNMLVISAHREDKKAEKDTEGNFTRREFSYQNFMRSFSLPENMVVSDKVSARYQDGILRINVPKSDQAKTKPAKQIDIS